MCAYQHLQLQCWIFQLASANRFLSSAILQNQNVNTYFRKKKKTRNKKITVAVWHFFTLKAFFKMWMIFHLLKSMIITPGEEGWETQMYVMFLGSTAVQQRLWCVISCHEKKPFQGFISGEHHPPSLIRWEWKREMEVGDGAGYLVKTVKLLFHNTALTGEWIIKGTQQAVKK